MSLLVMHMILLIMWCDAKTLTNTEKHHVKVMRTQADFGDALVSFFFLIWWSANVLVGDLFSLFPFYWVGFASRQRETTQKYPRSVKM